MRLFCMMLLAALLSCLWIGALAIEPGDIAEPSIKAPDMSMPTPKITRPSMDVPQSQPRPLGESSATSAAAANQTRSASPAQTQDNATHKEDQPLDVSGKWSLKFDNAPDRWLDLTLWSTAGTSKVMGFGKLMVAGVENSVTAVGTITGQQLRLNVQSATSDYSRQNDDAYDLDLIWENNTLSGTYLLSAGTEPSLQGNATATRL